jgi:hypothetical protein
MFFGTWAIGISVVRYMEDAINWQDSHGSHVQKSDMGLFTNQRSGNIAYRANLIQTLEASDLQNTLCQHQEHSEWSREYPTMLFSRDNLTWNGNGTGPDISRERNKREQMWIQCRRSVGSALVTTRTLGGRTPSPQCA